MTRVVIIGGGVVGALTARELTRYGGAGVTILEKSNDIAGGGASKANSGIAHAGFDAPTGSLKARFNVAGSRLMERLCEQLSVSYRRNGSMVVALDDEQAAGLSALLKRGVDNGVEGLSIIDGGRARELEPNLSTSVKAALLAETGGILCPYTLAEHAASSAVTNGAKIVTNAEVTKIKAVDGGFVVESVNGEFECGYIVNAAGVNAGETAALAGDTSINITPRRGEYTLYDKDVGGIVTHTIFQMPDPKKGKGVLVTPTADGNLLIGPSADELTFDSRENVKTTAAVQSAILSQARLSVPTLPQNGAITAFSGVRALSDTDDFIVGRSSVNPRLFNAAGIQSPGLTASPAIAAFLAGEIAKIEQLRERDDFVPRVPPIPRISELSDAELDKLIAERADCGEIVCRCETVSQGAIADAVRRGAVDTDGVKRRTRAGMGRCQGGFCLPRVLEIIAKERNVGITTVTKRGGESVYLTEN